MNPNTNCFCHRSLELRWQSRSRPAHKRPRHARVLIYSCTGSSAGRQAPAAAAAPAAAPTWSVGPMDLSGFIDGYYSFNFNRPNTSDGYDQINQLYNFNDKTDQFELSAAKLTLNHDPDPVGAHVDFVYGRTNELINAAPTTRLRRSASYIEQAFLSLKPPKAKGFEMDFGKFVTSAGAEVIEAKDNWNYSRSLLFVKAIPYWHFGAAHLDAGFEDRNHRRPAGQRLEQRLQEQRRRYRRVHQRPGQAEVHLEPELLRRPGESPTPPSAFAT